MKLLETKRIKKIELDDYQKNFVSSVERINEKLSDLNYIGYEIVLVEEVIGFIVLKKYENDKYFLWDFRIDIKHQKQGYGYLALKELVVILEKKKATILTTTYKHGNNNARKIYEKIGFFQTDVIRENDIYEINMKYEFLDNINEILWIIL